MKETVPVVPPGAPPSPPPPPPAAALAAAAAAVPAAAAEAAAEHTQQAHVMTLISNCTRFSVQLGMFCNQEPDLSRRDDEARKYAHMCNA